MDAQLTARQLAGPQANVCVKTGEVAVDRREQTYRYTPPYTWFFLPLCFVGVGILIVILLVFAVSTTIKVSFPIGATVKRDQRRRKLTAHGTLWGGTTAFVALAIATHTGQVMILAGLSFVTGLMLLVQSAVFQKGKFSKDGVVTLKNVSPLWITQMNALAAYTGQPAYGSYGMPTALVSGPGSLGFGVQTGDVYGYPVMPQGAPYGYPTAQSYAPAEGQPPAPLAPYDPTASYLPVAPPQATPPTDNPWALPTPITPPSGDVLPGQ